MSGPLKIFHLLGSPDSHLLSQLSVSYSHPVAELADHDGEKKYDFRYAFIHHDGKVSFLTGLNEASVAKSCTDSAEKHPFSRLLTELSDSKPDAIVYHILGRIGCTVYRATLETLGIPIVGSASDKHFITTNKVLTRSVLQSAGVSIAPGVELYHPDLFTSDEMSGWEQRFGGYPLVVKAATVEDSIGVFVARNKMQLVEFTSKAFELSPEGVAIEQFIPGREIRSLVIENENSELILLPIVEYDIGGPNNIRGTKSKIQIEDYERSGRSRVKWDLRPFLTALKGHQERMPT